VSRINLEDCESFNPVGSVLDINNEIVDFGTKNSWLRELDQVSFVEFMEVYAINVTAPFIICSQLKPLME